MPDQLLDLPSSGTVATQVGPARVSYPFLEAPTPDSSARLTTRDFKLLASSYLPTLADRTSYTNWLTYSSDLANAAWVSVASGTGTAASFTPSAEAGPDGGTCWRLQAARGAGNTVNDYSGMEQSVTGLTNPHNVAAAVWLKSNTGAEQIVQLYTANGNLVALATVTAAWQRFELGTYSYAATTDALIIWTRGDRGTTATLDLLVAHPVLGPSASSPAIPTTTVARTISAPPVDGIVNSAEDRADYFAYQVGESEPAPTGIAGIVAVTKSYARIPATQYFPSSRTFARPDLHDIKSGSHYAVSFDKRRAWIFSARKTINVIDPIIASTSSTSGSNTQVESTGVNDLMPSDPVVFVLTSGYSASFPLNATAASIEAAFSAGGADYSVSASNYTVSLSLRDGTKPMIRSISTSAPKVTIAGIAYQTASYQLTRVQTTGTKTVTETVTENTTNSVDASLRLFGTTTNHPAQVGDYVAFYKGDRVIATSIVRTIPATTTFKVDLADVPGKDFTADTCVFSSAALWCIAIDPPVTGASARRVQRFYLPGVTTGITNAADIPLFSAETDAITWLSKVVAYLTTPSEDTYFITDSGDVQQWRGPILMKEVTEVQMQDVVIQVSATA